MHSQTFEDIPAQVEWVGRRVIGAAIEVHRAQTGIPPLQRQTPHR